MGPQKREHGATDQGAEIVRRDALLGIILFILGLEEVIMALMLMALNTGTLITFGLKQAYFVLVFLPALAILTLVLMRKRIITAAAASYGLVVLSVLMARSPEERTARRRERMARMTHGMGLLMLILLGMIAFGGIAGAAAAGQGADVGGMVGVFVGGFLLFGMLAAIIWAGAKATRHVRLLHLRTLHARRGGREKRKEEL